MRPNDFCNEIIFNPPYFWVHLLENKINLTGPTNLSSKVVPQMHASSPLSEKSVEYVGKGDKS